MLRSTLLALAPVAAAVALGGAAGAQGRSSLEGTWILAGDGADARPSVATRGDSRFQTGTMGSGWGSPLTLAERGGRLVVQYPFFSAYDLQAPLRYEFPLDGSEMENDVTIGPTRTQVRGRATREGATLVLVTRQPVPPEVAGPGVMAEVRRELSVVSPDTLLVVTTRIGVAGAPTTVVRTTYGRKP